MSWSAPTLIVTRAVRRQRQPNALVAPKIRSIHQLDVNILSIFQIQRSSFNSEFSTPPLFHPTSLFSSSAIPFSHFHYLKHPNETASVYFASTMENSSWSLPSCSVPISSGIQHRPVYRSLNATTVCTDKTMGPAEWCIQFKFIIPICSQIMYPIFRSHSGADDTIRVLKTENREPGQHRSTGEC